MNAQPSLTLSLLLAAAVAAATPALAAGAAPHDGHEGHSSASTQLRLDHGRKWATDAPLRDGMTRIRALVAPQLAAAHAGRLADKDYAALAAKLDVEVTGIVTNCKLPPQADAVLHVILSELATGSTAMAGRTPGADRARGLVQVATAVNHYGRYFDHRGFAPIATGH